MREFVEKLLGDLPRRDYSEFKECGKEELINPGRFHLDPQGNLHVCQGIVVGNIFTQDLKDIVDNYNPQQHPVLGPIIKGGPALLAEKENTDTSSGYVDQCHLCFETRRSLLDKYPDYITPKQVYGVS